MADAIADRRRSRRARLDILKALGDNTRYAIYLELARSPLPLTTAEIADIARPARQHRAARTSSACATSACSHVDTEARAASAGPSTATRWPPAAPSLGLEPSPFPTLARMLLQAAAAGGLDGADAARGGAGAGGGRRRQWDAATRGSRPSSSSRPPGFDPAVVDDDGRHHRLRPLPASGTSPNSIPTSSACCTAGLRRGLVAASATSRSPAFHSLVDRRPCQVDLPWPMARVRPHA